MKRASEDASGGGDAKKSAGGAGGMLKGMPSGQDGKVEPIPRPFTINSITLHFNQRTWEEIGPGELKYLPLSVSPYYMLDTATLKLLSKYKKLWSTATYHTPKARISNIIMLQDDLVNQGGTPLETTAFTQACYMITYKPTRQSLYFKLGNMKKCEDDKDIKNVYDPLVYNLSDTLCNETDASQLIKVSNYTDFEHLAILTANVNEYAGFEPRGVIRYDKGTGVDRKTSLYNTFIPPNRFLGDYSLYSANMQPKTEDNKSLVVRPFEQVTWARNLDSIKFHKYGDVVDLPITTNLEGVKLLNTAQNDVTERLVRITEDKDNVFDYYQDFMWPSQNRPYFKRSDNLNEIGPMQSPKSDFAPLQHHFLTMPPIRKANKALLKQRASFILEQSWSVTFDFPESVWDEGTDDTVATSTNILGQKDAVIVRPVIYGDTAATRTNENAICPYDIKCVGDKCPFDNSFKSLLDLFVTYNIQNNNALFEFPTEVTGEINYTKQGFIRNEDFENASFIYAWKQWVIKVEGTAAGSEAFYFDTTARYTTTQRILRLTSSTGENLEVSPSAITRFVKITKEAYLAMRTWAGITCITSGLGIQHAILNESTNRDTQMFYV